MITIKKCQSKKHGYGGCGDPKCPEGLSIKAALDNAVKNHDLNSFLEAKQIQNKEPLYGQTEDGVMKLMFEAKPYNKYFKVPISRPELTANIEAIDKTALESYDDIKVMQHALNDIYRPYAHIDLRDYKDEDHGLKRLSVASMGVDADIRGLGVGKHMRQTILKFADEHGYVVTGTPTNSGDGTLVEDNENKEEYRQHAIKHRQRLIDSYIHSGYEYNYAYRPYDEVDYLTKEPYPEDKEYVARFNEKGKRFLAESGFYIRWPNNQIPKEYLAGYKFPANARSPLNY